jgi:hypothetical protein
VTAGIGLVGCAIAAGAVSNLIGSKIGGRLHNKGDVVESAVIGGLAGALNLVGGRYLVKLGEVIGAKIGGAIFGKVGQRVAGRLGVEIGEFVAAGIRIGVVVGERVAMGLVEASKGAFESTIRRRLEEGEVDIGGVSEDSALAFAGGALGPR